MKRSDIVKEARFVHVVASALTLTAGVMFAAWPELDAIAVRWILGAIFVVMGCARLFGYFANDLYRLAFQYDLALGAFCIIFGVLIVISPDRAQPAIPYAVGMYVLLDALLKLQTALDAKAFGMKRWIGLLVSSILVSLLGIVVLLGVDLIAPARMLFGIALASDGGENVWNTMATVRVRAKKHDRFEELL